MSGRDPDRSDSEGADDGKPDEAEDATPDQVDEATPAAKRSPDELTSATKEVAEEANEDDLMESVRDLEALFRLSDGDDAAAKAGIPDMSDIDAVRRERDEYLDSLRRLQADFVNFRKRVSRQGADEASRAKAVLIERLLPVLDAFDLAVAHAGEGPDGAALKQLGSLLADVTQREGLERIDTAGVPFEPTVHDAVAHVPDDEDVVDEADVPDDAAGDDAKRAPGPGGKGKTPPVEGPVVAEVLRSGYSLKGRVLRPAMVKVRG
ncbi:MAG TPA: nucleotide exchange factor GrpE [Acidimicrobiales bacterium]|nr:nucleotide exchange factor GrpE [Acidimicrobiales bacterium]